MNRPKVHGFMKKISFYKIFQKKQLGNGHMFRQDDKKSWIIVTEINGETISWYLIQQAICDNTIFMKCMIFVKIF
jgi:hypothetical protein